MFPLTDGFLLSVVREEKLANFEHVFVLVVVQIDGCAGECERFVNC